MPRRNCQDCKTEKIAYRLYVDHGGPVMPAGSTFAKMNTMPARQVCQGCAERALAAGLVYNLRRILRADLGTSRLAGSEMVTAERR